MSYRPPSRRRRVPAPPYFEPDDGRRKTLAVAAFIGPRLFAVVSPTEMWAIPEEDVTGWQINAGDHLNIVITDEQDQFCQVIAVVHVPDDVDASDFNAERGNPPANDETRDLMWFGFFKSKSDQLYAEADQAPEDRGLVRLRAYRVRQNQISSPFYTATAPLAELHDLINRVIAGMAKDYRAKLINQMWGSKYNPAFGRNNPPAALAADLRAFAAGQRGNPAPKAGPDETFFTRNSGRAYPTGATRGQRSQLTRKASQRMAAAEAWAKEHGYEFTWEVDPDVDSRDFSDEQPHWDLWGCRMVNRDGKTVQSLWGIDFGPTGEPWGQPYKRVVEAELALEQIHARGEPS